MAKARVQITHNMSLPIGCVCSECQTVRVVLGVAKIVTSQSYVINQEKAANIAKNRAELASKKLIEDINHYSFQNYWLGDGMFSVHVGEDYDQVDVTVSNIGEPCPMCGHSEPWQISKWNTSGSVVSRRVPEELFRPNVLQNSEDIIRWGNETALKILLRRSEYWKNHPYESTRLKEKRQKTEQLIELADRDLCNLPESKQLGTKQAEKELKQKQLKETKLFSPERKEFSRQIKIIENEIQELENAVNESKEAYECIKKELSDQLKQLERQSIGVEGKLRINKDSHHIWWQML